jgi:hypothetical protein
MSDRLSGNDDVPVRIPRTLRERVDGVYQDYRGYEPATFQESLSLVCDLAADGLSASSATTSETRGTGADAGSQAGTEGGADDGSGTRVEAGSIARPEATAAIDGDEYEDLIDQVFPYDWDVNPTVERRLPQVVAHYVANPNDYTDSGERERDAIRAVAREEDADSDLVRESLVSTLYGGAGLSNRLADEFFAEALAEAATLHQRPSPNEGTASSDGGVATEAMDDTVNELLELGTDEAPTADCEGCGTTMPVTDLETVIGPEHGSTVRLLCPDCADRSR